MDRRLLLHEKLSAIPGVKAAYFNSPGNTRMNYPCVLYSRTGERVRFASNGRYITRDRYTVTVIDRDPDSKILPYVRELPFYSFDRYYPADGLSHFVGSIYF